MFAIQYEVPLPADYDMKLIRERVAVKGPLLDALPGLGLKAYLIRERGEHGSPANMYGPFYLWATVSGMNNFLWGGGFRNFCDAFGRPAVQHWTGIAFAPGPARAVAARVATRRIEAIPPDADPSDIIKPAIDVLRQRATNPLVHSTALAIDTKQWELVHFTMWEDHSAPTDVAELRYEVLHASTPHLNDIPTGRLW
jgi:hypothetical protein